MPPERTQTNDEIPDVDSRIVEHVIAPILEERDRYKAALERIAYPEEYIRSLGPAGQIAREALRDA